jgi:alpha-ketoglutarate-dependent 2,4-dichlorophenoxyacetate dioxygenase
VEINMFFYGRENDRLGEPLLFDVASEFPYSSFSDMKLGLPLPVAVPSKLTSTGSVELDSSLVKPDSRRWHHSLGNALWHTDSSYQQHCKLTPQY